MNVCRPLRCALSLSLLVLAPLAALAGAAAPASAAQFTVTAAAVGFFTPANLTIHAGDSVTWTNSGGGFHNVAADSGAFRCSNGCDGEGGNGSPSSSSWSFTRTFNQAGTVHYYCESHGAPGGVGMSGTIVVQPATADQPGSLRFSAATYSVGEGGGSATITVQRVGGDDGAASVQYATANGTATAGSDYTAQTGTLNWANSDDAAKTFSVPILNDTADENNETVLLTLSGATGASLGSPASATLTITDNDGPPGPGGVPAPPTNLRAAAQSTSEILLTWTDASNDETEFRIERRTLTGSFAQVDTAAAGATSLLIGGLDPATAYVFRVRAANASGASAPSNEVQEATLAPAGPCVEGPATLCLGAGGRFRVEVEWRSAQASGPGNAIPLPAAPDSGLFYFFNPGNIEMLIKVLNACAPPFNSFWVFYAATTNVELTVTVTDTQTRKTRVYFNPLNRPAPPVQDTNAFATCP